MLNNNYLFSRKTGNTDENKVSYHIEYSVDTDYDTHFRRDISMIPIKSLELGKIGRYADNWDGYNSPGPNKIAVDMAHEAFDLLSANHFFNYHISPTADGGIAFTFRNAGKLADIIFYNDGDIDAGTYPEEGDTSSWDVEKDKDSILSTYNRIKEYLDL